MITILGSCRQESLYSDDKYKISTIRNNISYPHYSKETIELIKFCKYGHVTPEQTIYMFRTPILEKKGIYWDEQLKNEFTNSDIFIIEIASKICYEYNGIYLHHIAIEEQYDCPIRDNITVRQQTFEEIEKDIVEIQHELVGKKIIIVSHISTYQRGERFILTKWLHEICEKYNIPFINPVTEFIKMNLDITDYLKPEDVLVHYTEDGHRIIKKIYDKYLS